MRKALLLITCCISALMAWANDGAFYASGNHLIPITETDIRVQKEILTLNRIGDTIGYIITKFPIFKNFKPEGELYINEVRRLSWESPSWRRWDSFDTADTQQVIDSFKREYLPTRLYPTSTRENLSYDKFTPEQRRILKNLPFAYRGYIFKTKELQDFFESTPWYIPNPDYTADVQQLTPDEQAWVEFWK